MASKSFQDFNATSGWNEMLPKRLARPALQGSYQAKYAIVGSGYTGVAAARRLSELDPDADIIIIDASVAGEGSSGRNSGFTRPFELPTAVTEANSPKVVRMSPYNKEGFDYLRRGIEESDIQCWFTRAGVIRGAATEAGQKGVEGSKPYLDKMGIECQILSRSEMEQRTGTKYYRAGLYANDSYFVQPAALIRGLVDGLPRNVKVFENSVVRSIKNNGKWAVETDGGSVLAENLILATNAFIKQFGYLKSRFVAMYTYAAITEEVSESELPGLGSMPTWGILPAHRLGTTCRRVGPNRLMVRSLSSYESEKSPADVYRGLKKIQDARWPHLAHLKLEYVWGGATAFTMNGSPWLGKLDEGLYAAGGCNGGGLSKGTLVGKRLAELILNAGNHAAFIKDVGLASWMAPEPFRRIGYEFVHRKEIKEAGLEA